ncbi:MAG: BON domain-containing protein [Rhodospirillaceae bacterium]
MSPPLRTNALPRPRSAPSGKSVASLLLMALLVLTLGGCAGVVVGAGATVGVAALDERGVEGVARDTAIETQIRAKWLSSDLDKGGALSIEGGIIVHEGRALLTGTMKSEEARAKAVAYAWQVEGVKKVINEIEIGDDTVTDIAVDSWITAQLTSKLTLDQNVKAINFKIETNAHKVYIIGIARSEAEHRRVIGHARSVARVRDVIDHIRVKASAEKSEHAPGAARGA